jgi:hypothetical protein
MKDRGRIVRDPGKNPSQTHLLNGQGQCEHRLDSTVETGISPLTNALASESQASFAKSAPETRTEASARRQAAANNDDPSNGAARFVAK